jgi:hypothetical protein
MLREQSIGPAHPVAMAQPAGDGLGLHRHLARREHARKHQVPHGRGSAVTMPTPVPSPRGRPPAGLWPRLGAVTIEVVRAGCGGFGGRWHFGRCGQAPARIAISCSRSIASSASRASIRAITAAFPNATVSSRTALSRSACIPNHFLISNRWPPAGACASRAEVSRAGANARCTIEGVSVTHGCLTPEDRR